MAFLFSTQLIFFFLTVVCSFVPLYIDLFFNIKYKSPFLNSLYILFVFLLFINAFESALLENTQFLIIATIPALLFLLSAYRISKKEDAQTTIWDWIFFIIAFVPFFYPNQYVDFNFFELKHANYYLVVASIMTIYLFYKTQPNRLERFFNKGSHFDSHIFAYLFFAFGILFLLLWFNDAKFNTTGAGFKEIASILIYVLCFEIVFHHLLQNLLHKILDFLHMAVALSVMIGLMLLSYFIQFNHEVIIYVVPIYGFSAYFYFLLKKTLFSLSFHVVSALLLALFFDINLYL